jgi:hypothetical protein
MTKIAWSSVALFVLSGALITLPIDFAQRPPHIAQRMTRSEITNRAEASASPARRPAESYGRLPLSFEANGGQTDDQIKFVSHAPGFVVSLTPTTVVLTLSSRSPKLGGKGLFPQISGGALRLLRPQRRRVCH